TTGNPQKRATPALAPQALRAEKAARVAPSPDARQGPAPGGGLAGIRRRHARTIRTSGAKLFPRADGAGKAAFRLSRPTAPRRAQKKPANSKRCWRAGVRSTGRPVAGVFYAASAWLSVSSSSSYTRL